MVEEAGSSHSPQTIEDSSNQKNDILSKVKGPEKRGRVRCLGKVSQQPSSSSNANTRVKKLESLLENLVSILQVRFSEDPEMNEVLQAVSEEV